MPVQGGCGDLRGRVAVLRGRHVQGLPARQAEILVLLCLGFSEEETAGMLALSVSTVRNHWAAIRHALAPGGLAAARPAATAWGWLHSGCCLASAFDAVVRSNPSADARVKSLAAHHVEAIPDREKEILLLSAFGFTDEEIARSLFLSPSSVRSTGHHAHLRVVPPELAPGRANATAWVHLHLCILHRPPGRESRFGEIWRKRLVG